MKNFRYYIFWILDFLKGSPLLKHYKQIEKAFYGGENGVKIQEELLSSILKYAVNHTIYYSKYESNSIANFPVVDKSEIISNMDDMFSDEFKNRREILRTMTTSGSSGTPFKIFQNPNKVMRNKADLLFFYKLGNYDIGDKMYSMRIWNEFNLKSKKQMFKENFKMFDTSNLDVIGAESFIQIMSSDKSEKVLLAYASSFTAIMDKLKINDSIDWRIKSIFTGSEELPVRVKSKMKEVFRCPVMSRYANQENGIMGQQPYSGENYFELNSGSYYIEFLKLDSNEPANAMEEARIVITDLFNNAVPVIRYDTGDLGYYSYKTNKFGEKYKVIESLIGRKVDYLYSNKKEKLSPHIFTNLMWKFNYFKQFQLIQEDYTKLTLKLVYKENIETEKIEELLVSNIKELLGDLTVLEIVRLKNIPIEPSGKRKYIISKILSDV